MLNEQLSAIGLLARDIAEVALRPDAPDDLGVIYSDLAVPPRALLPPLGDPRNAQHAVMLARIMIEVAHRAKADAEALYEGEDDQRFPAHAEVFPAKPARRQVRRHGRERLMHVFRQARIGEGPDTAEIGVATFDNGAMAIGLGAGTSRVGTVPTCLLSPDGARGTAAALIAAAEAVEAALEQNGGEE